ncbi:MAG: hypothetical protein HKN82_17560 [Akkermansiaceae bacterium]|nr:hypothetical protein [Akkermansiaceae bacterium]NNM28151.1 hypothetical protein [Akkermansiaceae bacterium]
MHRCDRDVARILSAYGRTRKVEDAGHQIVGRGGNARRLPVSRVCMDVRDPDAFRRSFEKLTSLSDRVLVRGNEARFARAGRFFVIDNRLA